MRKVNYDPLTSFEPICDLAHAPTIIVINNASPYRTFADLLNAAPAMPGGLTLAGSGPTTAVHIAFEMLKRAAKVDMTFVPYPGAAPAVTASNCIPLQRTSTPPTPSPSSSRRSARGFRIMGPLAAQKKALAGARIKGLVIEPWFGVFVPAGTPAAIVARLNYLLSYANFNGMQIRTCRRSTEPAWVAQSGAPPAASAPGREYDMIT
jgi:tripartite-type tricarboxylate transporter receptor subunit TctC